MTTYLAEADVIVVGAGITGCAIYHMLTETTNSKVLLLERSQIASGTTGQSGGFVRQFMMDPNLREMAEFSLSYYRQHAKRVGFKQTGMTYQLNTSALTAMPTFLTQLAHTADTLLLNETLAGCIDTKLACHTWVQDSYVFEYTDVMHILTQNTQLIGVQTKQGAFKAPTVILAINDATNLLLKPLNKTVDITTKSFQYQFYSETNSYLSPYINFVSGFYLFPFHQNNVVAGFLYADKSCDQDVKNIDTSLALQLHQTLATEFPQFAENPIKAIKLAVDAFTPDECSIIKTFADLPGLIVTMGSSGGGVKLAPAIARNVVALLTK